LILSSPAAEFVLHDAVPNFPRFLGRPIQVERWASEVATGSRSRCVSLRGEGFLEQDRTELCRGSVEKTVSSVPERPFQIGGPALDAVPAGASSAFRRCADKDRVRDHPRAVGKPHRPLCGSP